MPQQENNTRRIRFSNQRSAVSGESLSDPLSLPQQPFEEVVDNILSAVEPGREQLPNENESGLPLNTNPNDEERSLAVTRLRKLGLSNYLIRLLPSNLRLICGEFSSSLYNLLDDDINFLTQNYAELLKTIENRINRLSSRRLDIFMEIYNTTHILIRDLHNEPIIFDPLYSGKKSAPRNSKYENLAETDEQILKEDAVFINGIGFFNKNDKRLVKDFRSEKYYLIIDPKYDRYYYKVFTKISSTGELIFKDNYTSNRASQYEVVNALPEVYNLNSGYKFYVTEELIQNPIFKEKYVENINEGYFAEKTSLSSKDYQNFVVKNPRKMYRKRKGSLGDFEDSIKNIPNTYQNTLGKRYPFGIEIETISGYLPTYLDKNLYYSAVHDGSLRDPDTSEVYGKLK